MVWRRCICVLGATRTYIPLLAAGKRNLSVGSAAWAERQARIGYPSFVSRIRTLIIIFVA